MITLSHLEIFILKSKIDGNKRRVKCSITFKIKFVGSMTIGSNPFPFLLGRMEKTDFRVFFKTNIPMLYVLLRVKVVNNSPDFLFRRPLRYTWIDVAEWGNYIFIRIDCSVMRHICFRKWLLFINYVDFVNRLGCYNYTYWSLLNEFFCLMIVLISVFFRRMFIYRDIIYENKIVVTDISMMFEMLIL